MDAESIIGEKSKPDLTPMIDVVFLLLIFFMVTTTIIKVESDLGIQLPTDRQGPPPDELPNAHTIDILPDGTVLFNGAPAASHFEQITLHGLIASLSRTKQQSDNMGEQMFVTIIADPVSPHFKSVEVLDACAAAGIVYVSFGNN